MYMILFVREILKFKVKIFVSWFYLYHALYKQKLYYFIHNHTNFPLFQIKTLRKGKSVKNINQFVKLELFSLM